MVKSLLLRLITLLVVHLVRGQLTNVTIDDSNTFLITYLPAGAWAVQATTSLDYPFSSTSSHTLSDNNPSASATFTFTGVAVYFWSPLWPYAVNTLVSLDGRTVTCFNLQDYAHSSSLNGLETVMSAPMLVADGLANTEHTLVISQCPGGPYIVVDAITYTVQNTVTSSSTTSGKSSSIPLVATTTTTATAPTASPRSHTNITAIAVGGSVGGVVVLGALFALLFVCSRRNRSSPANAGYRPSLYDGSSAVNASPSPAMSNSPLNQGDLGHVANNGLLYPNSQYVQNAPYNRWSPTSYYPNTLTTISEGSPPSAASRRPPLPEL